MRISNSNGFLLPLEVVEVTIVNISRYIFFIILLYSYMDKKYESSKSFVVAITSSEDSMVPRNLAGGKERQKRST